MKVLLYKQLKKVSENLFGQMEINMKEIGETIDLKEEELFPILMVV